MAIQTCLPLLVDYWVWKVDPQVIEFLPKSINVFWGGVPIPRPCSGKIDEDYLLSVQFNQPHWLIVEPMCVCNKLLYYVALYKKNRKRQWVLAQQSLIDFTINIGSFEMSQSRFFGNENGRPPGLIGCSITYPFDTRSTTVSFQQQLSIWEATAEVVSGNTFDFHLFNPSPDEINCDPFQCVGRDPGWYVQFVLKDVLEDVIPPDPPLLPPSP